ncbi:MAG TPA: tRNA preQ1(34) S-adenosylmethionine ribosyltransferase-isomerase QueA [Vicinamibacterales bacterium]|nr:tRNA preQ1(34) S-adenosylmethionine ribosyltransferase-isomerase QueA [Vicinamibacterales bacterium]
MDVAEFDFELPAELVAQEPPAERGTSRMLCLDRASGAVNHATVASLPERLRDGDVLVVNDSRVFPARLLGARVPSGGSVECLLIAPAASPASTPRSATWEVLMHPGQKLKEGARFDCGANDAVLHGEVLDRRFFGRRIVRLWVDDASPFATVDAAVDAIGHVPLPPYIKRDDRSDDRERYQTVFARSRGSVAAPTAGLHFTEPLLARIRERGVEVLSITLHVGYGTFQPVRVERVEDHRLHPERYHIEPATADAINRALDEQRRVVAVGTTTTRTLEAVSRQNGGRIAPGPGETDLFISPGAAGAPGFSFQVVSGLLTNFHLPKSSLLMLVAAFAGTEPVLHAYTEAIRQRYRFYSYGDAMLIL